MLIDTIFKEFALKMVGRSYVKRSDQKNVKIKHGFQKLLHGWNVWEKLIFRCKNILARVIFD